MASNYGALTPVVRVSLLGGNEYTVVTNFGDAMAWELYAQSHGLDVVSPLHMLAFYAWRGARKQGVCPQDVGLTEFVERFDGPPEPVMGDEPDPTQAAHGADSA